MATYTIVLTSTEEKVLLSEMADIQEWISNAIQERIRHACINCIDEYTEKNPKKLTQAQMISELTNINIVSAKDKEKLILAKMVK